MAAARASRGSVSESGIAWAIAGFEARALERCARRPVAPPGARAGGLARFGRDADREQQHPGLVLARQIPHHGKLGRTLIGRDEVEDVGRYPLREIEASEPTEARRRSRKEDEAGGPFLA